MKFASWRLLKSYFSITGLIMLHNSDPNMDKNLNRGKKFTQYKYFICYKPIKLN